MHIIRRGKETPPHFSWVETWTLTGSWCLDFSVVDLMVFLGSLSYCITRSVIAIRAVGITASAPSCSVIDFLPVLGLNK